MRVDPFFFPWLLIGFLGSVQGHSSHREHHIVGRDDDRDLLHRPDAEATGIARRDESGATQAPQSSDGTTSHSAAGELQREDDPARGGAKVADVLSRDLENAPKADDKLADIISRAKAEANSDLTREQSKQAVEATEDELRRLEQLQKLRKLEDVVSRANLLNNRNEEDTVAAAASEIDELRSAIKKEGDPLKEKEIALGEEIDCLNSEIAKLEDVRSRALAIQEAASDADRSDVARQETDDALRKLHEDLAAASQADDHQPTAEAQPELSTPSNLIEHDLETEAQAKAMQNKADSIDCDEEEALNLVKSDTALPPAMSPGDSPEESAIETELASAEEGAASEAKASVAELGVASEEEGHVAEKEAKLKGAIAEKDAILGEAEASEDKAVQDEMLAEKALAISNDLNADVKKRMNGEDTAPPSLETVGWPSDSGMTVRASSGADVPPSFTMLSHRVVKAHDGKGDQKIGSLKKEMSAAETFSEAAESKAQEAMQESLEAHDLAKRADTLAGHVQVDAEDLSRTNSGLQGAVALAKATAERASPDDCDEALVDGIPKAAEELADKAASMSKEAEIAEKDLPRERSAAAQIEIESRQLEDLAQGDDRQAACEEGHQAEAERLLAKATGESMKQLPHECDDPSICDEPCSRPPCPPVSPLPIEKDPCDELMDQAALTPSSFLARGKRTRRKHREA